jgi:circadian clock protein KaiB
VTSLQAVEAWEIELFIVGQTPRAKLAFDNLKRICEDAHQPCKITVIDLSQYPKLAKENQIVSTPTTIRKFPLPKVTLIGDLNNAPSAISRLKLNKLKGEA